MQKESRTTWFLHQLWGDLGFALALIVFAIHTYAYLDFFMDDAFISLRYVLHWINGNGLVYNIGEQVEGYSNFLWVVLLAALGRTGLDLVFAAKLLGVLLSIVTLWLTYSHIRGKPYAAIAPLLLAFSAPFAAWSMAGLETPLVMLLVLSSSIVFVREEDSGKGFASGFLLALLALTRPECALFAIIAFSYRAIRLALAHSRPTSQDAGRMTTFLLIATPYFFWRMQYYGYPLPNTIYAKSMGLSIRNLLEGVYYLYESYVIVGGLFFVMFFVAIAVTDANRPRYITYYSLAAGSYLLFIALAGGDWMPAQRFLASVLPLIALVVRFGVVRLTDMIASPFALRIVSVVILMQLGYMLFISFDQRFIDGGVYGLHLLSRPYPWVQYLKANVDPEDTIAVFDAGQVAYELPLSVRIVDMVGLADEHIAHLPPTFPGGILGRGDAWGKWDVDYVLDQNPRFVQVHLGAKDNAGQWATGFTGTTLLVNDDRFRNAYSLIESPGLSGLFERTWVE